MAKTRTRASKSKDSKIIAALIQSRSVVDASKVCGVSQSQIYARLKDDDFMREYDRARLEIVTQAVGNIQGLLSEAIAKLHTIMNDSAASPQVQLNAADSILRHCMKLTEQADILQRLDKLEKIEAERNGVDE